MQTFSKSLLYTSVWILPLFSIAQFGDLSKTLKKQAKKVVEEKIEEKNEEFETSTFNYAIAFLDKSESFENKQKGENLFKAAAFVSQGDATPRDEAVRQYEVGRVSYMKRAYRLAELGLKDALSQFEKLGDESDPVYLKTLGLLGILYSDMGRYEKASSYTEQALDGWKTHFKEDSKGEAAESNNLAVLHLNLGDFNLAERELNDVKALVAEAEGTASMPYAIVLNNQAILYLYMGRTSEADKLMQTSLGIAEKMVSENSGTYLQLMTNRALVLQESGDYAGAEEVYKNAIELQKTRLKVNRTSDPDYAHMLNNLAAVYYQTDRLAEAEELLKESLTIYKTKFGDSHPLTASAMQDLGNLYRVTKRYTEAGDMLTDALETNKTRLGEQHPKTVQNMEDLALLEWKRGNSDAASTVYSEVMSQTMTFINEFFPSMSEVEKTKYWEKVSPRFYSYYNFAFDLSDTKPELFERAINYRIATKGILLSTTTRIKNIILYSGDQELINLYQSWIDQKKALAVYYTMSKEELAEQEVNLSQLESEANSTEKQLSEKSAAFTEILVDNHQDYKTIQAKLKTGQAIVELVQYPYFDHKLTDQSRYAAIIIKPSTKPELVVLDNGNELDGKYYSYYKNVIRLKVDDSNSYANYWQAIDAKLGGYSELYLSPDGVYNQLNINTLKMASGEYLVQKKKVHLVGNIREVGTKGHSSKATKDAFLLAFPTYGSSRIAPLPGTEKEIGVVNTALKNSQYKIQLKTADYATESAIKNIASPKVVHIATHGFFLEDVQSSGSVFGVKVEYAKNNPLLRSGLLLAGASDDAEAVSFSEEDNGVLMAYEAINLDLSNTDMVVLSACETGKGDVKSGEGVYGLQRAFKVAGANTMIMSLWKVDDTATQMLMSSFYKNWTGAGMSVAAAFQKAQIDLMKTYPHPYYWGAFVMVE